MSQQAAASQQEGEQSTTPRPAGPPTSATKRPADRRQVTAEDKKKADLIVGYIKAYCIKGAMAENHKKNRIKNISGPQAEKKVAFANTVDALPLLLFVKHLPTAGTSTARNGLSPTTLAEHANSLCREFFEKRR